MVTFLYKGSKNYKMKKSLVLLFTGIIALATFGFALIGDTGTNLSIGDTMPMAHVNMKNIDGNEMNLREAMGKNGILVIFSCNTCPFVIEWEETYPALGQLTRANDIGMVLVNSNEAKRDGDDSMSEMKAHAEENNYNTSYVVDENHVVADAFGAKTTPHVFLFDKNMRLIYEGSIDDRFDNQERTVSKTYLEDAISNYSSGKPIDPNDTVSKGCSIKRVKKS